MRETTFGPRGDRGIGRMLGSVTLPRRPEQVATARRFVAGLLGDHPETDTAVLLTSEAVTNSVIHTAGATVTIVVVETPAGLRFEIGDDGAGTVPTLHDACDLREDGRGVFLLQHLSARYGFDAGQDGLTVWFEL
jgi:anti-sigma regulatory factor (Ser/Thr protein kinase)